MFKSTDRGRSWTVISPDLTTHTDRDTLALMGVRGRDTRIARNDSVSSYGNIVSFAESPAQRGLYYTGSDDGLVQVSRDGGVTWTNVTAKVTGLPRGTYVSEVAPSRFAAGTVYATFDGHRSGDFGTYVYASTDFGNGWRAITGDLPKGEVARTITEDVVNQDVLYLGTETGAFVTTDRGGHWLRVTGNLPTVPVYEITLQPRDNAMLLATHGRGIWILDDMTPLQHYAEARAADAYLFAPRDAVEQHPAGDRQRDFEGDRHFLGENPRPGAVSYYLKSAAKDVTLTLKDAEGDVVRELGPADTRGANAAGINTVYWDLRVAPLPGQQEEGGFFGAGTNGPFVLPGTYQVALTVDGKAAGARPLTVHGDPAIAISDADRDSLFAVSRELHTMHGRVNAAGDALNDMFRQLGDIRRAVSEAKTASPALKARVDSLRAAVDSLRRRVVGGPGFGGFNSLRGRVVRLKGAVMNVTALPTETQVRELAELRTEVPKAVDDVNALVAQFKPLLDELAREGVYPAAPKPVGQPQQR